MRIHSVEGGGGLRLHVREWGREVGPPIVFIHGWSQNHLCWRQQYESPLSEEFRLIAFDLRGHGMSEAPLGTEHYTTAQLWADDIHAVITQFDLGPTLLVGWSYGGLIICDYLRLYGTSRISGVNFVGAAVSLSPSGFGTLIGPGFLENIVGCTSDDLPTSIGAIRSFVRACTYAPMQSETFETAICWNMAVPVSVRAALLAREIDCDDVLSKITVPVLVSHGLDDHVILPRMAEHILSVCPTAVASWYSKMGHAPFLEHPGKFNRELSGFAAGGKRLVQSWPARV